MISGTVELTGSSSPVTATLILGPVDAPYDVLVRALTANTEIAVAAASFTLSGGGPVAGSWFMLTPPVDSVNQFDHRCELRFRLQEGDSLYAAVGGSSGDAFVSFIGNPA
jgi:hypothetical protein